MTASLLLSRTVCSLTNSCSSFICFDCFRTSVVNDWTFFRSCDSCKNARRVQRFTQDPKLGCLDEWASVYSLFSSSFWNTHRRSSRTDGNTLWLFSQLTGVLWLVTVSNGSRNCWFRDWTSMLNRWKYLNHITSGFYAWRQNGLLWLRRRLRATNIPYLFAKSTRSSPFCGGRARSYRQNIRWPLLTRREALAIFDAVVTALCSYWKFRPEISLRGTVRL